MHIMKNRKHLSFTVLFLFAALWNLIGAGFGYFNTSYTFMGLFGRELNDPLYYEIYRGAWGTTLMFFLGYLLAAYDPIKHSGIVLIGGIGKFFFALAELDLYLKGLAHPIILVIVIGDFIFCGLFLPYFYRIQKLNIGILSRWTS